MLEDARDPAGDDSHRPGEPAGGPQLPTMGSAAENAKVRQRALEWLQSDPLPYMLIARNVLMPLQRLQRQHCLVGSAAWQREELAKEATGLLAGGTELARTFPIVVAAEGVLEEQCETKIWRLLSEPLLWSLLPPASWTAKIQSKAFALLSRAGGLCHKELARPHAMMPFSLFTIIRHSHMAQSLKQTKVCLRDPFSNAFLQDNDLETQETRQKLLLIAKILSTNISEIECRHAALRRLLWRVQAKATDVENLASAWVAQRYRRRVVAVLTEACERASEKAASSSTSSRPGESGKRKTSMAPGPWRVFVAQQGSQSQGTPDLKSLGEKYRNLSPEEREACQNTAAVLKRAMKHDPGGEAGLGLGAKAKKRALRERQEQVRAQQLPMVCDSGADAKVNEDIVASGGNLSDALRLARVESRALRQRQHQREMEHVSALLKFKDKHEEELKHSTFAASSQLRTLAPQMQCHPCSQSTTFVVDPPIADLATKLVACCKEHPSETNVHTTIQADFVGKHKFIRHDECPPIDPKDAEVQCTPCWLAGLCVCDERGKKIRLLMKKLMQWLKRQCPRGSANLDLVRNGNAVLEIEGWEGDVQPDLDATTSQHWHICHLNLSPYEVTIQNTVWDGETRDMGRIELQAAGTWFHHHSALELLGNFDLKFRARLWKLDDSDRPLPKFTAGLVSCYPMDGFSEWLDRRRRPRRRRAGPRRPNQGPLDPGAGPMLAIGDGESSSGPEDDIPGEDQDNLGAATDEEEEGTPAAAIDEAWIAAEDSGKG